MRRLARDRVAIDAAIGLLTAATVVAPLSEAGPADAAADPSRATENRSAASLAGARPT